MFRYQISRMFVLCAAAAVTMVESRARAEFTTHSDGSDGALDCAWLAAHDDQDDYSDDFDCAACTAAPDPDNPNLPGPCTFLVDLSKALPTNGVTTKWDTPGLDTDTDDDGFGDGAYDPKQWAIVYKFTTIHIPPNVIVKFKNHPSGAPVAWLAEGAVNIHGRIIVDGANGAGAGSFPEFSEPGPGGFPGGTLVDSSSGIGSVGFGPGSSKVVDYAPPLACYSGQVSCDSRNRSYGNPSIFPLIGGSGGGVWWDTDCGQHRCDNFFIAARTGGAGGGAILIATNSDMILSPNSYISAKGGSGVCGEQNYQVSFSGSGGAIRLIAGSSLTRTGGLNHGGGSCGGNTGGAGRIRLEAPVMVPPVQGGGSFTTSFIPGEVFPGSDVPTLEVVSISDGGLPVEVPSDPGAGPSTIEVELDTDQPSQIVIRATNIPALTRVQVRVVPVLGNEILVDSTQLQAQADGSLRATASLAFPPGRSEIQLRANWTPTP